MNLITRALRYFVENRYNQRFLARFGLDSGTPAPNELPSDSVPNMVVWLRNIDRLISMVGVDRAATFTDLGCGTGVALAYARQRYDFEEFIGVEIQPELVKVANQNLSTKGMRAKTTVICEDVRAHQLCDARHVLFLFNPFGQSTLRQFLGANITTLRRTRSIMLIANDHLAAVASEFGPVIARDKSYRLTAVQFESGVAK